MRIRQIRPEFWTDEIMAGLPDAVRLFYVGLWNISDDGGYLEWRPTRIGALLYPYQPAGRRERNIAAWGAALEGVGRLVRFQDCDCACIPTLPRHQRITGKQAFPQRDLHLGKHRPLTDKQSLLTDSPVTLGNVTLGNGIDPSLTEAYRKLGLPVDAP